MPRDNKTPLIQKIARRAYDTFKNFDASAIGDNKVFLENQEELVALMTELRAADLNIEPRKSKGSLPNSDSPPVTYMHICETDAFSMGVFLLRNGASIPLHDHPGMNGMLKVLYGKVSIRCFDKLAGPSCDSVDDQGQSAPPPPPPQMPDAPLRRSVLRSTGQYCPDSGPCVLGPLRDNLHQIHALDGPAAFLDILAPPYDSEDGRDCHYYRVLQPLTEGEGEAGEGEGEGERETWLLEVPQPEDFWCGGEPYPGPKVTV
ncbi:LOW QUALITY PROTEIN: 2-aminoethanethiol (cysteamine) dioxygenase a [Aplochiton taeniatus]